MFVYGLYVIVLSCMMRQYAVVFAAKLLFNCITIRISTTPFLIISFCQEQSILTNGAFDLNVSKSSNG